jgi:hypothetical protein
MQEVSESPVSSGDAEADGRESKIRGFLTSEAAVRFFCLAVGALSIGFVFWWLQFSTGSICCGDLDGFYHVKWSQLLWQGVRTHHFPPLFTWLPLTTLNAKDYVDHHLLFHILLIPFTSFGDARMGAKIYTLLFASLAVFSCYWLMIRYRISYSLVWLVALLGCSAPFLFRMNMTKAMSLSIVLLVTGIYLLFQRRYIWILPLMFVFTLAYDLFALLGLAAFIWAVIVLWSERRIEWRLLLWVGIGVAAGFILNPYFPHNVKLFYEHMLMKVTAQDFSTAVGGEWYPYDSWDFLRNCTVAFIAMVTGYIAFNARDKKASQRSLFFLIFSTVLLIANARWKRFAEYWPPFAVLFAAFALQRIFDEIRSPVRELPPDLLGDLQPYLDRGEPPEVTDEKQWRDLVHTIIACMIAVILMCPLVLNLVAEVKEIKDTAPFDDYKPAMAWIQSNVPAGEIVFNTNWDNFPKMFYYDTTHTYVSGLDPTYLFDANSDLAKAYDDIRLGKEEDPGPVIRDRFKARYVFTANDDIGNDFYKNALSSGWFEEVYADDHSSIMRIRDQKGEPPPDQDDKDDADNKKDTSDDQSNDPQDEPDDEEDNAN